MAITKLNTRIQLKFDTWTNWNSTAGKAFIPLKGEVCVCEIPANIAATGEVIADKAYLIKVGDGTTSFGSLPWLSAQAADVHAWAKMSVDDFKAWMEGTKTIDGLTRPALATTLELNNLTSRVSALETFEEGVSSLIDNAVDTLGQSLVGTGSKTKTITGISYNKDTNQAIVTYEEINFPATPTIDTVLNENSTNAVQNKVVTEAITGINSILSASITNNIANKATADHKGNNIFDTYATKEALKEVTDEIGDLANVMNFKGVITTDPSNITTGYNHGDVVVYGSKEYVFVDKTVDTDAEKTGFVEFGDTSAAMQAVENLASEISAHKSFSKVVAGTSTLEADGVNDTLNVAAGTAISVTGNQSTDTMTIRHANVGTGAKTSTTLTPNHGGTFTIVEAVTVNSQGHVTDYQPRTVQLPAAFDPSELNSAITAIHSYSSVAADSGTAAAATKANEKLTIAGGNKIATVSTNGGENTDKITINHETTTVDTTAETGGKLNHGGSFTVIKTATADSYGHAIALKPVTYTLPEAYDDSALSSAIQPFTNGGWHSSNHPYVADNATTAQKSALAASNLTVGSTEVSYIIFDCGSASENI